MDSFPESPKVSGDHAYGRKVGEMRHRPSPIHRRPAPFAQAFRMGSRVAVDR